MAKTFTLGFGAKNEKGLALDGKKTLEPTSPVDEDEEESEALEEGSSGVPEEQ